MGVTSFTQELSSPIAAKRMFAALIVDANKLIPKLLPQFVASVDIIQGDGGSGSIEQVNFTEASHFKYVKHRIDELDRENLVCKYSMIEGDVLGEKLESIDYEVKFEASVNGGCLCKMTSKYNAIGDLIVDEHQIKEGKEKAMAIYNVVHSYLEQNPNVYA